MKPNPKVETERPWNGKCATTGLMMDDYAERLDGIEAPDWVCRAAIAALRGSK